MTSEFYRKKKQEENTLDTYQPAVVTEDPLTGSSPCAGRVMKPIVELAGSAVAKCQSAISLSVRAEL
jgi:hypothetical protein